MEEDNKKIILYTIGCPNCRVLERKLDSKGIKYQSVTDLQIMEEKGIKSAPFLEVGDELMNFSQALRWVNNHGNNA